MGDSGIHPLTRVCVWAYDILQLVALPTGMEDSGTHPLTRVCVCAYDLLQLAIGRPLPTCVAALHRDAQRLWELPPQPATWGKWGKEWGKWGKEGRFLVPCSSLHVWFPVVPCGPLVLGPQVQDISSARVQDISSYFCLPSKAGSGRGLSGWGLWVGGHGPTSFSELLLPDREKVPDPHSAQDGASLGRRGWWGPNPRPFDSETSAPTN